MSEGSVVKFPQQRNIRIFSYFFPYYSGYFIKSRTKIHNVICIRKYDTNGNNDISFPDRLFPEESGIHDNNRECADHKCLVLATYVYPPQIGEMKQFSE
jgi:hypothetical protein